MKIAIGTFAALLGATLPGMPRPTLAAAPVTHRLEVTPSTVAYGYYWADAAPVLRIASGDIIDVDTLLTNTPTGLAKEGVPEEKAPAPEDGRVSSNPPGRHAGNLDNRELAAGSTLARSDQRARSRACSSASVWTDSGIASSRSRGMS